MHKVTLIGKPGCHLCHKAKEIIERVVGTSPAIIEEIDIEKNPDLETKYHDDIPVVLVDNIERFKHNVDANKLAKYLAEGNIVGIDH